MEGNLGTKRARIVAGVVSVALSSKSIAYPKHVRRVGREDQNTKLLIADRSHSGLLVFAFALLEIALLRLVS